MLIGSPTQASCSRRMRSAFSSSRGCGRSLPERAPVGQAPHVLQPVGEDVQAGGEALVAVVDPDVFAEGDQGGKALGGQRAEELVQLGSGRRVAEAPFVDGVAAGADRKADGVVDQEEEASPAWRSPNPAACSGAKNASARARKCGRAGRGA
jgi:hypothetical protein